MALKNYIFVTLLDADAQGQNTAASRAINVKVKSTGAFASIFSDEAGATPITQPGAVTDTNGEFSFWAEPGIYTVDDGFRQEIITTGVDNGAVVVTTVPGATHTPNAKTGSFKDIDDINQNLTINAPTNPTKGQELIFLLTQDSIGGFTVSWNAIFKFNTAWSDTGNVADTKSMVAFIYDGVNWRQSRQQSSYI